jgi:hypothetical protein
MATNDEIIAKLPAVLTKLQETNERAARDAALAEKRKLADLQKQQTIANKKGNAKTRADLDAIQELKDLRKDIKDREVQQAAMAASTAGQAIALRKQLEEQGKIAEDNKEFQKLSYQARKEDYAQRLADATSPAAKKEIREEARADAKKNGSLLDKIAAGIGGLFEMSKKGLKAAALGGLAILTTLAIGAFVIALGKFLQSDTFKKMTAYIQDKIIPFLKDMWVSIKAFGVAVGEFYTKYLEPLMPIFKKYFIDTWENIGGLFSGLGDAFSLFADGEWWEGIKTFFSAIGTFVFDQLDVIATAIYNVIASIFGLSETDSVFGSISGFFTDLYDDIIFWITSTYDSIIKTISEFYSTLVGIIPALFLKLVEFVADMFSFEEFAKKIGDIDPIALIAKSIEGLISDIVDFFKMLFDFDFAGFAKSLVPDWAKKILGMGGSDESPEEASANRVEKLQKEKERLTELSEVNANTPRARQQARQAEILDQKIAREKASAAESLAVAEIRKDIAGGQGILESDSTFAEKKAKLAALEGQAMPISAGGGSGFGPQTQRIMTAAINAADLTLIEKDRVRREAEFKTAFAGAVSGPTIITDARRSSSVTTTGQTTGVIMPNKYGKLNMSDTGY